MPQRLDELKEDLLENGWIAIDLLDRSPLDEASEALLQALRRIIGNTEIEFGTYHNYITNDDHHIAVQAELTEIYREGGHGRRIITAQLALLREFIGLDISIQARPYLRIARPGVSGDNIDYHRDTQYGGSAYELSLSVPFLDLDAESALRVISGSHIEADQEYPAEQFENGVEKGGVKHQMGVPYAPYRFNPPVDSLMQPVPLKYGQALLLNLALVHGQKCNMSRLTRFSSDIRLVNSFAPILWKRGVADSFYEPLCSSNVSEQARRYLAAKHSEPEVD